MEKQSEEYGLSGVHSNRLPRNTLVAMNVQRVATGRRIGTTTSFAGIAVTDRTIISEHGSNITRQTYQLQDTALLC